MASSEREVIEALTPVIDPELGMGIVALDMVKAVEIRRGHVTVTVAMTVSGGPHGDEMRRLVTSAVRPLKGVKDVTVNLTLMTTDELARVTARTHSGHDHAGPARESGAARNATPLGHEEGRTSAFARPGSRTRVIGISSGKGGVGKSSVTVNVAVSLVRAGYDVGLLDADVYGFSIPAMLGIDADPTMSDDKMVPPVAFGVRVMSIGFFVDDDQPVMWRGPMLHKALEQFLVDVAWGDPDFLLIDMPPGTGDVALSMAQYLPTSEIYVVTTPQPAAKRVAQRSAYMAKKINLPVRGVIENMSWFRGDDGRRYELFGSGGGAELADELGVPLLGQVPFERALREGGDVGRPLTVVEPGSEAAEAFASVAKEIVARGRARIFRPELKIC
jgi:ATP-binding protein involved in chromosome partitioning